MCTHLNPTFHYAAKTKHKILTDCCYQNCQIIHSWYNMKYWRNWWHTLIQICWIWHVHYKRAFLNLNKSVINELPKCTYHSLYCTKFDCWAVTEFCYWVVTVLCYSDFSYLRYQSMLLSNPKIICCFHMHKNSKCCTLKLTFKTKQLTVMILETQFYTYCLIILALLLHFLYCNATDLKMHF